MNLNKNKNNNYCDYLQSSPRHTVGQNSSVSIVIRYGLDGSGIESRWRRGFPHLSRPALEHHPASYTMVPGLSPEVKRSGCGFDQPPRSSAEVKEE